MHVVWLPGVERTAFVGALETCWRDRTYYSHRGIDETIRSLQKFPADFTLTFRSPIAVLFGVEIGSRNYRKLSRSIEDFGLHDKIAPSDFNARFLVFS